MLKNPFVLYILAFGGVLCAYQLGWSEIYPELSSDVLTFFGITFAAAILLGVFVARAIKHTQAYMPGVVPRQIFPMLMVACAADILYAGGIPLWMVISGHGYSYNEFGIPTLHVAIMTFSQAFAVIRFTDYLYSKKRVYLLQVLAIVGYDLLIINRGAVLFTLVSIIFVIIIKRGGIGFKRALIGIGAAMLALYMFGVIGEVRSGDVINEIGRPTSEFVESGVPQPYFWAYIYMTSPLANFQNTVDRQQQDKDNPAGLLISEMMPDFVSKRLLPMMHEERTEFEQITTALNVSGLFTRSYVYFGWVGTALMFIFFSCFIVAYIAVMQKSPYRVPALALLNTLIVFSVFDNMIAFSGMSLQLLWPLILQLKNRRAKSSPPSLSQAVNS